MKTLFLLIAGSLGLGVFGAVPALGGEVLTNTAGKRLECEVAEIGEEGGVVTGKDGKPVWIARAKLSKESNARLEVIKRERVAAEEKKKAEAVAERQAIAERLAKERAASVDFRGVYLGMAKEDLREFVRGTFFGWDFTPEQASGPWCSLKIMPPDGGAKLQAYDDFRNLALDGEGAAYRWHDVLVSFEKDRIWSLGVNSVEVSFQDLDLKLKPWLKVVKTALVQKYGKPAAEMDLEQLNMLSAPPGGFTKAVAVWKLSEKHTVSLRIGQTRGDLTYFGLIEYVDTQVAAAIQARKEKVKGGL